MTLITVPTAIAWRKRNWLPNPVVEVNRSRWNHARKVLDFDAGFYSLDAAIFPATTESLRREVRAFHAALRGPANTFRMLVSSCNEVAADLVTTSGAVGGAMSLPVSGTAGMVLARGQYATIVYGSNVEQLVMLTATTTLSGGGTGTISFDQALRGATLTIGATVKVRNPSAILALDDNAGAPDESDGIMTWSFSASEAF